MDSLIGDLVDTGGKLFAMEDIRNRLKLKCNTYHIFIGKESCKI